MTEYLTVWFSTSWGVFCSLIVIMLWFLLAGAMQEYTAELSKKESTYTQKVDTNKPFGDVKAVVVSDIHCDTWEGVLETERADQIKTFSDAIRNHTSVEHLILNGDLIDIPRHPNSGQDPTTLVIDFPPTTYPPTNIGNKLPNYRDIVTPLFSVPNVKTTYIVGNHDVGLQSTRSSWIHPLVGNIALIWSPAIQLDFKNNGKPEGGRKVHIEHGHQIDPFIWLYIKQAVSELLRMRDTYIGPVTRSISKEPDLKVENLDYTDTASIKLYGSILNQIVMLQFRHGARRILKRELANTKPGDRIVRSVLLGHTHSPDRYFFKIKGETMVYFNSGSWTSDRNLQTYLLIYDNGWVTGPYCWETHDNAQTSLEKKCDQNGNPIKDCSGT
jgi:predicted phosphodiesterase